MPASWLGGLEAEARQVLPDVIYEYYRQGSGESVSADEAVEAWARYRLLPRVLADVREVSLVSSFLGLRAEAPLGVAPTTLQRAANAGGEVAMAAGCVASGVPMVVSSNASADFSEIAATGVDWWLQAYLPEDRELAVPMLSAAVAAGAAALVLTVDTPVVGTKYDGGGRSALGQVPPEWLRTNLGSAADAPKARDLGPADIDWLGQATGLPVVVKGVLHPEDARRVLDAGAAAVWVSNHGGRQLDRSVATADALAGVAAAVGGQVEVYVDGGVRSGLAAVTALALGADGIFLGRLPLYALAVGGTAGVERLFSELFGELTEALQLVGSPDPRSVEGVGTAEL